MRFRIHPIVLILLLPLSVLAHIDPRVSCLTNLRQLDDAKETLGIYQKLKPGDAVDAEALKPYLPGQTLPHCPSGGEYTIGLIGVYPVCSLKGHSEAERQREMERQARHERILPWLVISCGVLAAAWFLGAAVRKAKRAADKRREQQN